MWKPVYNMKYPSCERRFTRRDLHIYGKGRETMKNRVRELRTIISLEKGQYNPSLLLAYRLALVFRTTVEDLYCLAENKEQEDRENEEWT